jgi:predicted nuclease with TOPRIM domain
VGEVEFFSFDTIFYKKLKQHIYNYNYIHLYIMVEDCRDAAISQLNHALGTLTAAVDTATVRHHLDYVKTRLTQYIHTAEAVLEIKDGLLIANESEINTLKREIQRLQKENRSLKEKQNSLPGGNLRAPVSQWCATSYANRD